MPRVGSGVSTGSEERLGSTDGGRIEEASGLRFLHDSSEIHDRDPRRHVLDGGEVVADEQIGKPELGAQVLHEVEDLRLHGDVQGRGRLVAYNHPRAVDERPGDRHPLALPAGELARDRG